MNRTDHDPFCGASNGAEAYYQCSCDLIRRVRADEREAWLLLAAMDKVQMDDLRAKVEALRDNAKTWQDKSPSQTPWSAYVAAYDHVLRLIEGGNDG